MDKQTLLVNKEACEQGEQISELWVASAHIQKHERLDNCSATIFPGLPNALKMYLTVQGFGTQMLFSTPVDSEKDRQPNS